MKNLVILFDKETDLPKVSKLGAVRMPTDEEITDTIIDSFNEQIVLSERFKKAFKKTLDEIEFAYPGDSKKLQNSLEQFFSSSHKRLSEYMKKTLDFYSYFLTETGEAVNDTKGMLNTLKLSNAAPDTQWICDWQEQLNSLRNVPENLMLIKNDNVDLFIF